MKNILKSVIDYQLPLWEGIALILALSLLLACGSCSLLKDLESTANKSESFLVKSEKFLGKAQMVLRDASAKMEEHKGKADVNKDGRTDSNEWLNYLLGLVGLSGLGGGGLLARNAKSNARKDILEAKVARLEDQVE